MLVVLWLMKCCKCPRAWHGSILRQIVFQFALLIFLVDFYHADKNWHLEIQGLKQNPEWECTPWNGPVTGRWVLEGACFWGWGAKSSENSCSWASAPVLCTVHTLPSPWSHCLLLDTSRKGQYVTCSSHWPPAAIHCHLHPQQHKARAILGSFSNVWGCWTGIKTLMVILLLWLYCFVSKS